MDFEYQKINIQKSLDQGRIIYNLSFLGKLHDITNRYLPLILIIPFILFPSFLIYDYYKKSQTKYLMLSIVGLILGLIVSVLIIKSTMKFKVLNRISGKSTEVNRKIVKEIANQFNWSVADDNEKISILILPMTKRLTNWGSQFIVIYDNKDILVNCTSYGNYGIKSSLHADEDQKEIKVFKEYFNNKIVTIA